MISRYPIDFSFADFKTAISKMRKFPEDYFKSVDWFNRTRLLALTWNGRTALRMVLRMHGLRPGEAVVVPLWTCSQVHKAILSENGQPYYVDMRPGNFMPCLNDYADAVLNSKARIVIPISYWGYPVDINALRRLLPPEVKIVQDCCLSFGSKINGVQDGAFADDAIFSFGVEKPFCLGGGGGAFFSHENLQEKTLRAIGLTKPPRLLEYKNLILALLKRAIFHHPSVYGNLRQFESISHNKTASESRVDSEEEGLYGAPSWLWDLAVQKKSMFEQNILKRRKKFEILKECLKKSSIQLLEEQKEIFWNCWLPPFLLPDTILPAKAVSYLCRKGFEAKQPYVDILFKSKKQRKLPNLIIGPSLDLMTEKQILSFSKELGSI